MKSLPTFTDKPEIEPVSAPDVQSSYERMAAALQNVSTLTTRFLQEPLERAAKQKGTQEGIQEDYNPKGTPITPLGIAEREAAITAHRSRLLFDIKSKVNQLYLKYSTPKSPINPDGGISYKSFPNFQQALTGWSNGYISGMSKTFQPYAKEVLNQYAQVAQTKLIRQTSELWKKQQTADIQLGLNQRLDDLADIARRGDKARAEALLKTTNQEITQWVSNGFMSPKEGANEQYKFSKTYRKQTWLGECESAIVRGKYQEWVDKVHKSPDFKDRPIEREQILQQGAVLYKGVGAEVDTSHYIRLEKQLQNLKQIQNGGSINTALLTDSQKVNPHQAATYLNAANLYKNSAQLHQSLKYLSAKESNDLLDNFKVDPNDPNAFEDFKTLAAARAYNRSRLKEFNDDPAGFLDLSPIVTTAVQSAFTSPGFDKLSPTEQRQRILSYKLTALVAKERQMGISETNLQVIPKQQLAQEQSKIKALPPTDAILEFNNYIQDFPEQYRRIAIKNLYDNGKGVPFAKQRLIQMAADPNTRSEVPSFAAVLTLAAQKGGQQALLDNARLQDSSITTFRSVTQDLQDKSAVKEYVASLYNVNGNPTERITDLYHNLTLLTLYHVSKGMNYDNAQEQAIHALISQYQTDSYNGKYWRAPTSYPYNGKDIPLQKDHITDAIAHLFEVANKKGVDLPTSYAPFVSSSVKSEVYTPQVLSTASVQTLPDESGLQLVDYVGNPITIHGHPLQIKFEDLVNPHSQLNLELAQQPSQFKKRLLEVAAFPLTGIYEASRNIPSIRYNWHYRLKPELKNIWGKLEAVVQKEEEEK